MHWCYRLRLGQAAQPCVWRHSANKVFSGPEFVYPSLWYRHAAAFSIGASAAASDSVNSSLLIGNLPNHAEGRVMSAQANFYRVRLDPGAGPQVCDERESAGSQHVPSLWACAAHPVLTAMNSTCAWTHGIQSELEKMACAGRTAVQDALADAQEGRGSVGWRSRSNDEH